MTTEPAVATVPTTTDLLTLPPPPAHVHFIGIGGIGMSGLARILHAWGYRVSGSDAASSATTDALVREGVAIVIGHHDATLAGQCDLLVTTLRAERGGRVEIAAAHAAGASIVKRGHLLALLANERRSVAVAGTHGKSTTTGMLTVALRELGADPTYAIGAVLAATGANAAPGDGPFMAVEADEFDRAFLWLRPEVAVVTSVAYDHPDIFSTEEDYDAAFAEFVTGIQQGGTLVLSADDGGCQRLRERLRARLHPSARIVTYGETADADWRLERETEGWRIHAPGGDVGTLRLQVPGTHNAHNATAAVAALGAFGFNFGAAARAVSAYSGVGRRFELKGTTRGIAVIDDYAHHPDEIVATLQAARERYSGRRVWIAFQPHTFSRTQALLAEFARALDGADRCVLLAIFPSGETDTLGISSGSIADQMTSEVTLAADPDAAAAQLVASLQAGDVLLTLGAGDVTRVGSLVLTRLAESSETAHAPGGGGAASAPARRRPLQRAIPARGATRTIPEAPHLKIMEQAAMSLATTMRVGGPADLLVRASTPDDLAAAVRWGAEEGLPITVIGGGSNLLVGDGGIRGLTVVARTPGERAEKLIAWKDEGDAVLVTVGAQAPLSWAGRFCAEHGWRGMDWGVGLPGQIGGATANNAGAHGTELKDHLVAIELLHESGTVERVPAEWLAATYRMTKIKGAPRPRPWTILRATFRLPKGDRERLVHLADDHAAFRKRTQPTGACSGSTFANPPGDFAGRLLEEAGLKGHTIGNVQLSPKHANWVVNNGGGTAAEVWALIEHARAVVRDRFGIDLRPEIERVGEPND
ncbi:MAG: UDP-N-acetylmuramate--L-alanine ligase [Chloroflexia bacterium]|nr:UDP-N-acetylmuramate--L-alanine ligase [Chloroflexia bacterium]